jgi:hypothetical protein
VCVHPQPPPPHTDEERDPEVSPGTPKSVYRYTCIPKVVSDSYLWLLLCFVLFWFCFVVLGGSNTVWIWSHMAAAGCVSLASHSLSEPQSPVLKMRAITSLYCSHKQENPRVWSDWWTAGAL